jgi:RluA family pseudouridine synthase
MIKNTNLPYDIVYEDEYLVAVNKQAGVLAVPDRYNPNITNLKQLLNDQYGEIFVVHRLDKGTSGIMIYAKDAITHKAFNEMFEKQEIEKIYHVLVKGIFPKNEVDIDIPIMPSQGRKGMSIPSARGKQSLTKVKVMDRYDRATMLECDLVTGRSHQIRVHLSTLGFPLYVDLDYGGFESFKISDFKKRFNLKKNTEERPILDRLSMHAFSMRFVHPRTNEEIYVVAEYHRDFAAMVQLLSKYNKIYQ